MVTGHNDVADSEKSPQLGHSFALEIATKLNFLLDNFRKEDGSRYTGSDIEAWSKSANVAPNTVPIEQSWVWKLSHAQAERPSLPALMTISSFFGIDPTFWVKPLDQDLKLQTWLEGCDEKVRMLALKLVDLSPPNLEIVASLVDAMRNNDYHGTASAPEPARSLRRTAGRRRAKTNDG